MAFLFPGKRRPGMPGVPSGIQRPPYLPLSAEEEVGIYETGEATPGQRRRILGETAALREKTEAFERGFDERMRRHEKETQRRQAETAARGKASAAEKREREVRAKPYTDFMPPGPAREAAEARAAPAGVRGRRAGQAARRGAAASVGRVLSGRGAGTVERFAVTELPSKIEGMDKRLAAYRERERKRKAKARAGKRSVLRGRGRYGTRRTA